jgi:hypothetical protein
MEKKHTEAACKYYEIATTSGYETASV